VKLEKPDRKVGMVAASIALVALLLMIGLGLYLANSTDSPDGAQRPTPSAPAKKPPLN
jgi:hypothetical protein